MTHSEGDFFKGIGRGEVILFDIKNLPVGGEQFLNFCRVFCGITLCVIDILDRNGDYGLILRDIGDDAQNIQLGKTHATENQGQHNGQANEGTGLEYPDGALKEHESR